MGSTGSVPTDTFTPTMKPCNCVGAGVGGFLGGVAAGLGGVLGSMIAGLCVAKKCWYVKEKCWAKEVKARDCTARDSTATDITTDSEAELKVY